MKYENTPQFITDFKQHLSDNGITNAQIAKKMGITSQQLQSMFKKKELTISDISKMCDAIGYKCNVNISRKDLFPLI